MTRRRSGTNWSWLQSLIESSLRQQPGFQENFRLEGKICTLGDGLFHKNYALEAGDKKLVLRLAKVECGLQSRTEAIAGVRSESKTLQTLQLLEFPFAVPELICLVTDDSGESIGLIESAVAGMPLNFLSRGFSTVLHGDLLPQNLLFAIPDDREITVVDWECAQIGDAAYDLAIVTRGVRRPLGVANGLQRLVLFYNEAAEQKISPSTVVVHELLLHLHWLAESQTENRPGGHGPEHYANLLGSILRRALAFGRK